MSSSWYVRREGKIHGPIDSAGLKQLASKGEISERTEVSQGSDGPWSEAKKVRGLFAPAAGAMPPPTPAPMATPPDLPDPVTATVTAKPKSWFFKIAKWVGISFVALLCLSAALEVINPEGMKKIRAKNAEEAAEKAESESPLKGAI